MNIIVAVIIAILITIILGYLINLKTYIAEKFKQKSYAQAQIMRSFDRKNKELLIDKLVLKLKYALKDVEAETSQWINKKELEKVLKALIQDLKEELNSNEIGE